MLRRLLVFFKAGFTQAIIELFAQIFKCCSAQGNVFTPATPLLIAAFKGGSAFAASLDSHYPFNVNPTFST